jgi:hypothetical protein
MPGSSHQFPSAGASSGGQGYLGVSKVVEAELRCALNKFSLL